MEKQRLLYLLDQHESNCLTDAERVELEQWYETLDRGATDFAERRRFSATDEEMFLEFRRNRLKEAVPLRKMGSFYRLIQVAAILIGICLAGGAYLFFSRGQREEMTYISRQPGQHEIDPEPGRNKAVLTLANGSKILLDSAANGELAIQGNVKVVKLADGRLAYNGTSGYGREGLYNTMSTPRGGQYELTLPDGTKVWLNSASEIRYPTAFGRSQRKVEISGEVYFEVAPSLSAGTGERIPFKVSMDDGEEIEVLGTHFNVNAYREEGPVKTTLLEGSVKLTKQGRSVLVAPGQQAVLTTEGYSFSKPDLEKVMAWKTGFFDFDNLDLASIMRQISRWYDVDVVFDSKPSPFTFGGRISKNLPLSGVLKMFEENGVAFRMEGNTLHVDP
jgi:transmembrane sensor